MLHLSLSLSLLLLSILLVLVHAWRPGRWSGTNRGVVHPQCSTVTIEGLNPTVLNACPKKKKKKNKGAPELLGGFAAGIALSRRFFLPLGLTFRVDPRFNRQIYEQMKPIIHLFTPIFFVMVGLSLDLSAVDWGSSFIWMFSISIAVVAIIGKLLGGVPVRGNPWARVAMGL